ncbi:helix-hairpin-helix domain-containing protein [Oryzomonas japonica]|uniref:Helix-hairpin-helix domain-containing protein n=1 Tax=Oryzomonas japonica TaxID=2603858 RepID=A0A7J4ZUF7_9BACT|nr:helix-hairpin-helix domain-containing protein [Oryzomonas japonica]KAB0666559.1 helix-hairpin-helix domain-containing protein [Oryzomonas japonica]
MVRYERIILLLVAAALLIPAGIRTRQSAQKAALAGFSVKGFVRVEGDVAHPGMYPLAANIMTQSAIKMAEPLRPLKRLAPAGVAERRLKNGEDIRLTIREDGQGDVTFIPLPASERMLMGIPLDINTMGAADFDRLPGIGPLIAGRIVAYRQNNGGSMALEELLNVEGIGEKRYETIKRYF